MIVLLCFNNLLRVIYSAEELCALQIHSKCLIKGSDLNSLEARQV